MTNNILFKKILNIWISTWSSSWKYNWLDGWNKGIYHIGSRKYKKTTYDTIFDNLVIDRKCLIPIEKKIIWLKNITTFIVTKNLNENPEKILLECNNLYDKDDLKNIIMDSE